MSMCLYSLRSGVVGTNCVTPCLFKGALVCRFHTVNSLAVAA
jgi:hypothetical protein